MAALIRSRGEEHSGYGGVEEAGGVAGDERPQHDGGHVRLPRRRHGAQPAQLRRQLVIQRCREISRQKFQHFIFKVFLFAIHAGFL